MVGEYKVSLETTDAKQEIESRKKEVNRKTAEAKEKIRESIEKEKSNIDEDAPFAEGVKSFLEGIGKVAEGAVEIGGSIGNLTLNIGDKLLSLSGARLKLNKDGTGHFGTKKWGANIQWKVENGQLYIWGNDEDFSIDTDGLTIKKIDGDNFDLIGDDLNIHLKRVGKDK